MSEQSERGDAATDGAAEPQPIQPRDDGSGDQTQGTEFVGGEHGEAAQKDAERRAAEANPGAPSEPTRPIGPDEEGGKGDSSDDDK